MLIGIYPLIKIDAITSSSANITTSISLLASLFLFSIPVGYGEHQLVVNIYRSEKLNRPVHIFLKNMILENQNPELKGLFNRLSEVRKSALLTSLLDVCVYSKKSDVLSESINDKLSDRWSHFYARKAVGKIAPIIAILSWAVFLAVGYLSSWTSLFAFEWQRFLLSIVFWILIFLCSIILIGKYSSKIWAEINFVESEIVLSNIAENKKLIGDLVKSLLEHPEYFDDKGNENARTFWSRII